MKLKLTDNAIDSLKISMDSFRGWMYADDGFAETKCLKFTIFFLHNAMELLLKAILIKYDRECIYCKDQDSIIEDAKIQANIFNMTLDEYLIKKTEIKTIGYQELVNIFREQCCYVPKMIDVLTELGNYRNSIAHFGIDDDTNTLSLINVIYETYALILDNSFYSELLELDEYFKYDDVIDNLESWCEDCEEYQREIAINEPQRKLEKFKKILNNAVISQKIMNFTKAYNIDFENHSKYENYDIFFEFNSERGNVEFRIKYDAFYNYSMMIVTFCVRESIVFIVMHEKDKICLYDWKYDYYFEDEGERIKHNDISKSCKIKPLTEKNIRDSIVQVLRDTII
jgi:hypothetical protein